MKTARKGLIGLGVGALGVVFGDIGTSPLYALKAIFGSAGLHIPVTQLNVHGIISLVLWSVTIVVSVKYVGFIMRADNKGEGGIIALVALLKNSQFVERYKWFFIFLGLLGVALFYGDSAITPAISVMSAVEGLKIVVPGSHHFIVPITLVILVGLFLIQQYGTSFIGRLFGPVMLVWFACIGAGGLLQILAHPEILRVLSPVPALELFYGAPRMAFTVTGAVVLTITGAEALYADMGHFGRPPISRAWFFVVFPALALCYMGQGALLLTNAHAINDPFIIMFPEATRVTVIILATLATLIASQSVISGAFSLTRQATQLNFLPKMLVKHTSEKETGQVYLPFVNFALCLAVVFLVILFGSSEKLANAYGIAVSGTLAIDTVLFLVVARVVWRKSLRFVLFVLALFIPLDLLFVTANSSKILHGGWFPILLAAIVFYIITTWIKGQKIIAEKRLLLQKPLADFVKDLHTGRLDVKRLPGAAIYVTHRADVVPLALKTTTQELRELHQHTMIVSVHITNDAHVPKKDRVHTDTLHYHDDGVSYVRLRYGFHDVTDIPKALASLHNTDKEFLFDMNEAIYFTSLIHVLPSRAQNMVPVRKTIYGIMNKNAMSQSDYYHLPPARTIELSSTIEL
ncbi:MAG: KUP/HAK/KT family potassium transporter [Candidatus Saccharimonadales bacterium]